MVKIVEPPPKLVIPQGIPASGHKTSLYDKNKNHENNFFKWYMNHKNSGSELVFLFDSIGIDKDISLSVNFQKSFSHKFAYFKGTVWGCCQKITILPPEGTFLMVKKNLARG